MRFEVRKRSRRPFLQIGVVPALGIGFEQRHRLLMSLQLDLIVALIELLSGFAFQVLEHFLVLAVERRRYAGLDLTCFDELFQFGGRLLMVLDHPLRERLGVLVGLLFGQSQLTRLDFEQISSEPMAFSLQHDLGEVDVDVVVEQASASEDEQPTPMARCELGTQRLECLDDELHALAGPLSPQPDQTNASARARTERRDHRVLRLGMSHTKR